MIDAYVVGSNQADVDWTINQLRLHSVALGEIVNLVGVGGEAWLDAARTRQAQRALVLSAPARVSAGWETAVAQCPAAVVAPVYRQLEPRYHQIIDLPWHSYNVDWSFAPAARRYGKGIPSICMLPPGFAIDAQLLRTVAMPAHVTHPVAQCMYIAWSAVAQGADIATVTNFTIDGQLEYSPVPAAQTAAVVAELAPRFLSMVDQEPQCLVPHADHVRVEDYISTHAPELYRIYRLAHSATAKSVAILNPGASLELVDRARLRHHDLLIGVDYAGMMVDCDYVFTEDAQTIMTLLRKYRPDQLITPVHVNDWSNGYQRPAHDIDTSIIVHAKLQRGRPATKLAPPFCDFDNPALTAVHAALFMKPKVVALYGLDDQLLDGRSHARIGDYYGDGCLWEPGPASERRFQFYQQGYQSLRRLAIKSNIPVLRIGHL
jgi:hypothetical protein